MGCALGEVALLPVAPDRVVGRRGIFAFGNVKFHGSLGGNPPPSPVVAAALLNK